MDKVAELGVQFNQFATIFYWAIGLVLTSTVGTFAMVIKLTFKGSWWLSKLDAQVDNNTHDILHLDERSEKNRELILKMKTNGGTL